jgi:hypothetical protein
METLLNLLWLVAAIAVFGLWILRWIPARGTRRYSIWTDAIALIAALALLFPVISLTDDLHPEIAVVDASSGKKGCCHLTAGTLHAHGSAAKWIDHSPAAVLKQKLAQLVLTAANVVVPFTALHTVEQSAGHHGRSPPVQLL